MRSNCLSRCLLLLLLAVFAWLVRSSLLLGPRARRVGLFLGNRLRAGSCLLGRLSRVDADLLVELLLEVEQLVLKLLLLGLALRTLLLSGLLQLSKALSLFQVFLTTLLALEDLEHDVLFALLQLVEAVAQLHDRDGSLGVSNGSVLALDGDVGERVV